MAGSSLVSQVKAILNEEPPEKRVARLLLNEGMSEAELADFLNGPEFRAISDPAKNKVAMFYRDLRLIEKGLYAEARPGQTAAKNRRKEAD